MVPETKVLSIFVLHPYFIYQIILNENVYIKDFMIIISGNKIKHKVTRSGLNSSRRCL
jgi:hypothetical protein